MSDVPTNPVEESLSRLHAALADRFLEALRAGLPTAPLVKEIREFLRDNKVTVGLKDKTLPAVADLLQADLQEDELPFPLQ